MPTKKPGSLPDRIKCYGVWWRVERKNFIIENDEVCLGRVDFRNCVIEILSTLDDDRAWVVLFHEIFHILDINNKLEEDTTNSLAWGMHQVLKDNELSFGS
jgi:hypothetical protein